MDRNDAPIGAPATALDRAPSLNLRLLHLAASLGAFAIAYPLANLHAHGRAVARHVMLGWDASMPFLPWMIVPYMTSGALFAASFLLAPTRLQLRALSQRVLCATVLACAVFVAWPLRFHLARPALEPGIAAALFDLLAQFDRPYNQLPSLHVAYCVLFWGPLRAACANALARAALSLWIVLVAVSTLFTWQHHLLDVAAGLALGLGVQWRLPPAARVQPPVAFYYLAGAAVALLAALTLRWFVLAYVGISLALVALAYARDRAGFIGKRGGAIPLASWLAYGPYLLGYWLTWQAVRLRERAAPPFLEMTPGLYVGRRLSAREARGLPPGCAVIDLANELSETGALRTVAYRHYPLFDLAPAPAALVDDVVAAVAALRTEGRPVYLHCAMGYSRSIFLATSYLQRHPHVPVDLPAQTAFPAAPASPAR